MNGKSVSVLAPVWALILVLTVCQALIPAAAFAEEPPLTVLGEQLVTEVIDEKDADLAKLAPDESALAWVQVTGRLKGRELQLCVYTFTNADKVCYTVPEQFTDRPYDLAWSPDAAHIAFTEDPIGVFNESDIWVFDHAAGTFANRTDDGVEGDFQSAEDQEFALDYLPMWDRATGNIYFWRSVPTGTGEGTLALYRLDPQGGPAELVYDKGLSDQLPLFNPGTFFMDGVSAISPDGTQLAAVVRALGDATETPDSGLWVLDLTGETASARQLGGTADFQTALPEWQPQTAIPVGLSWTSDGAGVVVAAYAYDAFMPFTLLYYADVESGDMTPVVDFSNLEQPDASNTNWPTYPTSAPPYYFYTPVSAALTPAGDKLLIFSGARGRSSVLASPLPPVGEMPAPVYDAESYYSGVARSSRGDNAKVVMSEVMFTIEE